MEGWSRDPVHCQAQYSICQKKDIYNTRLTLWIHLLALWRHRWMADDLKEANIKTEHVLRCIVSHHQREKNMPVSQSAEVYSQYRSSSVYGLGKVCVLCKHFLSLMHTNTSACGHVSTKYRHCMHIHVRTNLQPQLTSTRILLQLPSDVLHRPALGSSCRKPTTEGRTNSWHCDISTLGQIARYVLGELPHLRIPSRQPDSQQQPMMSEELHSPGQKRQSDNRQKKHARESIQGCRTVKGRRALHDAWTAFSQCVWRFVATTNRDSKYAGQGDWLQTTL